jgi:hypothetical protein
MQGFGGQDARLRVWGPCSRVLGSGATLALVPAMETDSFGGGMAGGRWGGRDETTCDVNANQCGLSGIRYRACKANTRRARRAARESTRCCLREVVGM